ncbi:hypothetical protein SAMN02744783_04783 [Serratia sp. CC22-02]|uniref:crAss001_48 related protein n=1 Tax=Serratia sp. CC22-02 TaxID=1378076 RepID=UPI0024039841|nr:hypothetical protein [Serratia sp. CC22-02]SMP81005.1 hypothetical protein SAMN02744783_04783 [Serratia sp. CC22-02]
MTPIPPQEPYQLRVTDERNQLAEKLQNLKGFITGPAFKSLAQYDKTLLNLQAEVMSDYLAILNKRISRFS